MSEQLDTVLTDTVQAIGLNLWGYQIVGGGRERTLCVYLETPSGLTAERCSEAARHIRDVLRVHKLPAADYLLEVSSPGIERILFVPEQFERYVGEHIKVTLNQALDGQRNFVGALLRVDMAAGQFYLQVAEQEIGLAFDNCQKARLVMV